MALTTKNKGDREYRSGAENHVYELLMAEKRLGRNSGPDYTYGRAHHLSNSLRLRMLFELKDAVESAMDIVQKAWLTSINYEVPVFAMSTSARGDIVRHKFSLDFRHSRLTATTPEFRAAIAAMWGPTGRDLTRLEHTLRLRDIAKEYHGVIAANTGKVLVTAFSEAAKASRTAMMLKNYGKYRAVTSLTVDGRYHYDVDIRAAASRGPFSGTMAEMEEILRQEVAEHADETAMFVEGMLRVERSFYEDATEEDFYEFMPNPRGNFLLNLLGDLSWLRLRINCRMEPLARNIIAEMTEEFPILARKGDQTGEHFSVPYSGYGGYNIVQLSNGALPTFMKDMNKGDMKSLHRLVSVGAASAGIPALRYMSYYSRQNKVDSKNWHVHDTRLWARVLTKPLGKSIARLWNSGPKVAYRGYSVA